MTDRTEDQDVEGLVDELNGNVATFGLQRKAATALVSLLSRLRKAEGEREEIRQLSLLRKAQAEASQSEAAALREKVGELEKGLEPFRARYEEAVARGDMLPDFDPLRRAAQLLKDNPDAR